VNSYLKDRLVGAGQHPDQVSLVYNGPVLARTANAVAEPSLRGDHRYLVCWAGKMGRQDRVDLVVRVADHLVHELGREDCGFVLLGDGECLDEHIALVRELGLERWVSFPGWIPEADLFSYLATADIGIDTSLQVEVSPVKVMEYMAQGLPVVCFDLQESRLLADGAGVFTTVGDVPEIATKVAELLGPPASSSEPRAGA
jgi:glycosyltransferase involved in cell wall biosynthesis